MQVKKEEILHIAKLADLTLSEEETDTYLLHLEEILNFAEVVNRANVEGLDITISANEAKNVFRKDEIVAFESTEALLENAPAKERNMFQIPKVIN